MYTSKFVMTEKKTILLYIFICLYRFCVIQYLHRNIKTDTSLCASGKCQSSNKQKTIDKWTFFSPSSWFCKEFINELCRPHEMHVSCDNMSCARDISCRAHEKCRAHEIFCRAHEIIFFSKNWCLFLIYHRSFCFKSLLRRYYSYDFFPETTKIAFESWKIFVMLKKMLFKKQTSHFIWNPAKTGYQYISACK